MRFTEPCFCLIVAGLIALVGAGGCSSGTTVPPGGQSSTDENLAAGTLRFPGIDGYSESFTIQSAEPSSGVRARVTSSLTYPSQLARSSALCSPSNVGNSPLFITLNVSASVAIVPGSLVVTVPANVSTNGQVFWSLFVDATSLPSACDLYPGSPNTDSDAHTFTFDINGGASTMLIPGHTYELVISSGPFLCCPESVPSAAYGGADWALRSH